MAIKICPHCGDPFEGRANRTYCSTSCKSAINNARVAERDVTANYVAKIVKNNRRILMQLYDIYGERELPSIIISATKLNKKWYNTMSTDGKQLVFLDCILKELSNGNFIIYKYKNNGN